MHDRHIHAVIVFLSLIAFALCAIAEDEIDDLVDIAESDGEIIAIIEGGKIIPSELRKNETVLWSDSSGNLGAFLTNVRFFVISTASNAWQVLPLKLNEIENGVAALSPNLALLVAGNRAVGFDAASNRFVEKQLPLNDEVLAVEAEKTIAVVITSNRAYGFAAGTSAFVDIHFRIKESVVDVKVTSNKAIVRTTDRLLTFDAKSATWNVHRF